MPDELTQLQVDFLTFLSLMEARVEEHGETVRKIDVDESYLQQCISQAKKPLTELIRRRTQAAYYCLKGRGKIHTAEKLQQAVVERSKHDQIYWINNWCFILNPHLTKYDFPVKIPFVLFPKQQEYILWKEDHYHKNKSGLVYKCRDVGVSWLNVTNQAWHWFFEMGFQGRLGSLKAEEVDDKNDPDSLFQKLRTIIYSTPTWMRPVEFHKEEGPYDNLMKIFNPVTKSTISGQRGDNMGRGGRAPQPLYSKLLTPTGWTTMGKVRAGDLVVGANGKPTSVLKTHPITTQPIYKVAFSDGSSTECAEEHLWQITDRMNRKTISRRKHHQTNRQYATTHKVLSAKELLLRGLNRGREHEFHIPLTKPVEHQEKTYPLDPYVVGALLGDGSVCNLDRTSATFTTAEPEIITHIERRLPKGCRIKSDGTKCGYRIADQTSYCGGRGHESRMRGAIRASGIAGMKGAQKRIPAKYKLGSVEQRLELLRGLMDTDGWLSRPTKQHFGSTSPGLAADVREIVQSLGGTARITTRPARKPRPYPGGNMSPSKPFYNMVIRLPKGMNPFKLGRKANKYRDKKIYGPIRKIVSIEPCGRTKVRCISVAAPDGLYLTDEHIVTHNSMYDIDEWAKVQHDKMVDANLSLNCPCRFYTGTAMGRDNDYAEKLTDGKIDVFSFDWWDDPRKSQDWLENAKETYSKAVVEQEILKSLDAFTYGTAIPSEWVSASVELWGRIKRGEVEYAPQEKVAGLDVAAGGSNRTVMLWRSGVVVEGCEEWDISSTTKIARIAGQLANDLELSVIQYDPISVGVGVRSTFAEDGVTDARAIGVDYRGAASAVPLEGDTKLASDRCANRRAELMERVRKRFENTYEYISKIKDHPVESMIAIPPDIPKLRTQLSVPERFSEHGKIRLESKESMVKRGVDSPDYFDATLLAFANEVPDKHVMQAYNPKINTVINETDQTPQTVICCTGTQNWISVYHTKQLGAAFVGGAWNRTRGILTVYTEYYANNPTVQHMVFEMNHAVKPEAVHEYVGNKEMFKKGDDDLFMEYLNHNVLLMENCFYNETAAIAHLNEMIEMRKLRVMPRCTKLLAQLDGFVRGKGGAPDKSGMEVVMALCTLIGRLTEFEEIQVEPKAIHHYWRSGLRSSRDIVGGDAHMLEKR